MGLNHARRDPLCDKIYGSKWRANFMVSFLLNEFEFFVYWLLLYLGNGRGGQRATRRTHCVPILNFYQLDFPFRHPYGNRIQTQVTAIVDDVLQSNQWEYDCFPGCYCKFRDSTSNVRVRRRRQPVDVSKTIKLALPIPRSRTEDASSLPKKYWRLKP
jgi:hypothetical protein